MIRNIIFILTTAFFGGSAHAIGTNYCYGKAEKALAQELLTTMPGLQLKMVDEARKARDLRDETCVLAVVLGQLPPTKYNVHFYLDSGYRPILVAADRRHLDPLRVQAAMYDWLWNNKMLLLF